MLATDVRGGQERGSSKSGELMGNLLGNRQDGRSEAAQPRKIRLRKQRIKHQPALVFFGSPGRPMRANPWEPRMTSLRMDRLRKHRGQVAPGLYGPLNKLVQEKSPLPVNHGQAIQRFAGGQHQLARSVTRLGGLEYTKPDVSVVTATNRPAGRARVHPRVALGVSACNSHPKSSSRSGRTSAR